MRSSSPGSKRALSRVAARVIGSRFAKPVARVVLVAAGLVLLAIIGRASAAGALGFPRAPSNAMAVPVAPIIDLPVVDAGPPTAAPPAATSNTAALGDTPPPASAPHGRATSDDPVVLNTASADDLRRLPGIGQKRADAILALRARVGRFRAVEDLMKVKGIGRAMIKRLRPLVRVDAPLTIARLDAGTVTPR
jgi:competence protein ComEA